MTADKTTREQLVNLLVKRQAHMTFEDAVANFPQTHINTRPPQLEYTFWHLVEHLRFCQWDILDYIRNANYEAQNWPVDYWPPQDKETDWAGWNKTVEQFLADRQTLVDMVEDPAIDIYAPIPHGYDGHNILREIHVAASHNAYHIGELGILRQVMNLWAT